MRDHLVATCIPIPATLIPMDAKLVPSLPVVAVGQLWRNPPAPHSRATQLIAAGDREIDELVYALYGLSEDEVAVVEGG